MAKKEGLREALMRLEKERRENKPLIARYIELGPEHSVSGARLRDSGVSVSTIIRLLNSGADFSEVAREYEIPEEAVKAAEAFYQVPENKEIIDAKLLLEQDM